MEAGRLAQQVIDFVDLLSVMCATLILTLALGFASLAEDVVAIAAIAVVVASAFASVRGQGFGSVVVTAIVVVVVIVAIVVAAVVVSLLHFHFFRHFAAAAPRCPSLRFLQCGHPSFQYPCCDLHDLDGSPGTLHSWRDGHGRVFAALLA